MITKCTVILGGTVAQQLIAGEYLYLLAIVMTQFVGGVRERDLRVRTIDYGYGHHLKGCSCHSTDCIGQYEAFLETCIVRTPVRRHS